jgi:hypothetical protein
VDEDPHKGLRFRHNHTILPQLKKDRNGRRHKHIALKINALRRLRIIENLMNETAKYFDIRSRFWSSAWDEAASYEDYLARSEPKRAANWQRLEGRLPSLSPDQETGLRGHGRILNVLVVSGVWCGDCVRQGPMFRQIAAGSDPTVALRVIDRDQNTSLRDEVRILGAARVPVVVFLSEDFHEVGRFGDRSLHTYRGKVATEIGDACAVPTAELPPDALAAERDEWVAIFERMLLMVQLAPPLRARHDD